MADQPGGRTPGFNIKARFYPLPLPPFRTQDWPLIREVTGLEALEWADRYDALLAEDQPQTALDPLVLLGLIAIAIWHENPTWRRSQVVQYVEQLPEEPEMVGMEPDGPPQEAGEEDPLPESISPESSPGSSSTAESLSEPSNPSSSGQPESLIGLEA